MSLARNVFRSPLTASVLVSVVIFLAIAGLRITGSLEPLELGAYDYLARLRPRDHEADSRIVIIKITDEDILKLGDWPLRDAILAQVLTELVRHQPRAIGIDIYRDIPVPPGGEELNAVLTNHHNIITVMKFHKAADRRISPPQVLQDTDQVGFNDVVVDPGGIVRRGLLFLDDGETVFYSFALRLALLYLQGEGVIPQPDNSNPAHIQLGKMTIPPFTSNDGGYVGADDQGYQFLLDFRGAREEFPSYSLTTFLSGSVDSEKIKDKIVLIGTTGESVPDFFYTPFSRGPQTDRRHGEDQQREKQQQISGVALHAHIVSQLLRFGLDGTPPIAVISERAEALWIILWSLTGGMVGIWVRSPLRFSLTAVIGLGVLGSVAFVAFLYRWWLPLVPPAMAWLISAAVVTAYMSNKEKRERTFLMHLFSRHVSNEVAESVWLEREEFLDGGRPRPQKLTATVLFTDIVGFTAVSENLDPKSLMDWLNEYMEAMGQQVIEHGGVINKYIGDAIMAVFGVPIARKTESEKSRDAANAVNCALAMEKKLVHLNDAWHKQELPRIGMRVGIFTGPLVAGSLGSAQRLEYTVIGDTVNTASRLESFDKDSFEPDFRDNPCRIFIGEATLRNLDSQFITEQVGEVALKGKSHKLKVYRVFDVKEEKFL